MGAVASLGTGDFVWGMTHAISFASSPVRSGAAQL